jgi:KDEL-tailed cysteine endopeptidase
MDYGFE